MLARDPRLLRGLISAAQPMVHLGQLQEVFDPACSSGGRLVVTNRCHPRVGHHVHAGDVSEDPGLDLGGFRFQLPAALEGLIRERQGIGIVE